jgi:hypothetical protein
LRTGGGEHSAKQKPFGTVLADGPIVRILLGGEKVPWPIGGLFRRHIKTGGERVGRRGITKAKHCACRRKKGEPAKAAVRKITDLCLDITDLLMEVDMPGSAAAVEIR